MRGRLAFLAVAIGTAAVAEACGDEEAATSRGPDDAGSEASPIDGGVAEGGTAGPTDASGDARGPNIGTWRVVDSGGLIQLDYTAVWTAGPNVYVAGNGTTGIGAAAYEWNGTSWTSRANNSGYHFEDISGSSANDVLMIGWQGSGGVGGGLCIGYDGGAWGRRQPCAPLGNFYKQLWTAGPNDYWAVSGEGLPTYLFHFTGQKWDPVDAGGLWAVSYVFGVAGHIYALGHEPGTDGYIVQDGFNGTWTRHLVGPNRSPRALWGTSPNELFIVGDDGLILHWNGQDWTPQTSGTTRPLYAVWGTAPDDVFVAGNRVLLHYDGAKWTEEALPDAGVRALNDVWGSAPNDVWAVGQAGVILRRQP